MIALAKPARLYNSMTQILTRYLTTLSQLLLRLLIARVFLLSGLTKWNAPFQFNTTKYDLFMYEFFCPDPVRPNALQLCSPDTLDYVQGSAVVALIKVTAVATGVLEIILPILLSGGLFTRFAAFGLLAMTLFIQLAVFPGWGHWWNPAVWWALALILIVAQGPGKWSLDYWLKLDHQRT